ncbi:hypothetical protein E2C01_102002 [Portunus trituberculatus]|uniref:Uncharacterized protein n=1 Tax=Portunus trituberculatus TaxID=210409 RepID=A0A5B7KLJ9_PORTR|nr:hypothetical protein [Portunus trituberculatus]
MSEECIFKFKYGEKCEKETKGLQKNKGPNRIQSIVDASRKYGDNLHIKLQEQLTENPDLTISYHKNCASRYTSKSNLGKYGQQNTSEEPPRKLPFSSTSDNIVCTVGKSVTLRKTINIQIDGDQHIFVAQRSQSKTKDPTKNFCRRDVFSLQPSGLDGVTKQRAVGD